MDQCRILRRLDDPWKLGLWELDVAGTFVFFLCLGFMKGTMASFFGSVVLGYFVASRISKLKVMRHTGFLMHFMYRWLPREVMFMPRGVIPPSHLRVLTG